MTPATPDAPIEDVVSTTDHIIPEPLAPQDLLKDDMQLNKSSSTQRPESDEGWPWESSMYSSDKDEWEDNVVKENLIGTTPVKNRSDAGNTQTTNVNYQDEAATKDQATVDNTKKKQDTPIEKTTKEEAPSKRKPRKSKKASTEPPSESTAKQTTKPTEIQPTGRQDDGKKLKKSSEPRKSSKKDQQESPVKKPQKSSKQDQQESLVKKPRKSSKQDQQESLVKKPQKSSKQDQQEPPVKKPQKSSKKDQQEPPVKTKSNKQQLKDDNEETPAKEYTALNGKYWSVEPPKRRSSEPPEFFSEHTLLDTGSLTRKRKKLQYKTDSDSESEDNAVPNDAQDDEQEEELQKKPSKVSRVSKTTEAPQVKEPTPANKKQKKHFRSYEDPVPLPEKVGGRTIYDYSTEYIFIIFTSDFIFRKKRCRFLYYVGNEVHKRKLLWRLRFKIGEDKVHISSC
jgi:hypothetical protein